jgi:TldD protein
MDKYRIKRMPRRKFMEMSLKGGLYLAATPALITHLSCSTKAVTGPGMDIDKAVIDKVIAKALARGGEFADVYLENRVSRQIIMEESLFRSGSIRYSPGSRCTGCFRR